MSVSVQLVTRPLHSRELEDALKELPEVSNINFNCSRDFLSISFTYNQEKRILSVFQDVTGIDYGFPHSSLSVNLWGSSEAIMTHLHKKFKGFYCPNDCDDIWASHP
jgi:hypothetical protein